MDLQLFSVNEDIVHDAMDQGATPEEQPENGGETPGCAEGDGTPAGPQNAEVSALAGRVIKAEAKALLAQLGVPAKSAQYVLRLIDERAAVDENGEPDESAIKAQVQSVLRDVPALRGNAAGGFNPPPGYALDPFEEGFERG